MNQILVLLQAYNMRHGFLEGGANLVIFDDGTASLRYDDETIVSFDMYDEDSVRDYLLNQ